MKKIKLLAVTVMMAAVVTACSQGTGNTAPAAETKTEAAASTEAAENTETNTTAAEAGQDETNGAAGETASEGKIKGPFLVTSCGQSPGAVMINMAAMQEGFTSTNDNGLSADTFSAGDYKTLIVTTGTSMKGMGAAGTDVDAEIDRCVALIKKAKEAGLTIVGAHVEGMARRADNSDAASIEAVMELADVILVIDESDSDGFFTDYANKNNKPLIKVTDALAIPTAMEK